MRKERKAQLYFGDDNKFEFRRLLLQDSCLVEKSGDEVVIAWPHSFAGQYPFRGYKKIPANMVSLGFSRDIFLDIHNKIPDNDTVTNGKPKATDESIKSWIAKIGENQRHLFRTVRRMPKTHEWVNYTLMIVIGVELIVWVIRILTKG